MADISKIKLPSGNEYDIKDAVARQMISGGVSFNIVWTQADYASSTAPTAAKLATIPAGAVVAYNNGASTAAGTLVADGDASSTTYTPGFYLVYSKTQAGTVDKFDEYVTITHAGNPPTYSWEKIGDTQIDLSNIVTDVELDKSTASVIGSNSTFTVTQPTVALSTGATAGTGVVSLVTGISGASASGDSVTALTGLGSPSTKSAIGASSTFTITQPTISMALADSSATGKVGVITGVSASTTKLKASASGADVGWSDSDEVTALTGLGTPTTATALTGVKVTAQPSVALSTGATAGSGVISVATNASGTTQYIGGTASGGGAAWNSKDAKTVVTGYASPGSDTFMKSVSATTKKLKTTSITGVSGSTNITPVESRSSQTTATGAGTASTTNTDWLKSISVSNETLTIGAATLNTQTTYSAGAPRSSLAVPKAATATTVATGALADTDTSGATVATGLGTPTTASALTGLGSPSTASVIGSSSTFTNTQPTITMALADTSATGKVGVVTGVSASTTNIKATASGTTVGSNGTASVVTGYPNVTSDTVIGSDATFDVTQPSVTLSSGSTGDVTVATNASGTTKYIGGTASGANTAWNSKDAVTAVTGYASPTTDTVLGTGSTITVTPTTTNVKATASGANTAWNSKDAKTVLTNATDITVTKGGNE